MKTIDINESSKNNCTCKKCKESFIFKPDEAYWIEQGMYSEKVVKCINCNCINVVKHVDGLNQNPNYDKRYF